MAGKTAATEETIGRVGQRRQVVIPRKLAETLNIREGDFVAFRKQANGVLIKPKRVVDADDILTAAEAKNVRRARKQVREGKTIRWARVKNDLGL